MSGYSINKEKLASMLIVLTDNKINILRTILLDTLLIGWLVKISLKK